VNFKRPGIEVSVSTAVGQTIRNWNAVRFLLIGLSSVANDKAARAHGYTNRWMVNSWSPVAYNSYYTGFHG